MKTHCTYTFGEYTYWLVPVFKVTRSGFVRVVEALMYSPGFSKYFGTWARYNMPMSLVHSLESYCRFAYRHNQYQPGQDGLFRAE